MHDCYILGKETDILNLSYKSAPFEDGIKELLVKVPYVLTPFEVSTVKTHQIAVFSEWRREYATASLVPAINHLKV